ncbi:hypothetical protein ACIRBZ_19175 [Streptomyces sp. NPDC094038]|uniref:hypothetical protein n=1 Tax=Streptomyces sp. NPDC094038 TaxID=3366055 RepID=UPI0038229D46
MGSQSYTGRTHNSCSRPYVRLVPDRRFPVLSDSESLPTSADPTKTAEDQAVKETPEDYTLRFE